MPAASWPLKAMRCDALRRAQQLDAAAAEACEICAIFAERPPAWIRELALPNVPPPLRDSFLHRRFNASILAAWARARL